MRECEEQGEVGGANTLHETLRRMPGAEPRQTKHCSLLSSWVFTKQQRTCPDTRVWRRLPASHPAPFQQQARGSCCTPCCPPSQPQPGRRGWGAGRRCGRCRCNCGFWGFGGKRRRKTHGVRRVSITAQSEREHHTTPHRPTHLP